VGTSSVSFWEHINLRRNSLDVRCSLQSSHFRHTRDQLAFLILGLLIMAYCFLTPFLAIHGVLKTTKQRKTFEVIQAFDEVYKRTSKALETKDPEETRKEVELLGKRLTNLKAMLDVLTLAPEWPWDINMLRTFIVSLALPVILFLAQRLLG